MKNRKCHHYHCNNELKNSQPKFCSLSCSTKEKNRLSTIKKKETYNKNPNFCKTCNSILVYEIRTNKFCSHSCSATYNNTGRILSEASKQNIRTGVNRHHSTTMKKPKVIRSPKLHDLICKECSKSFRHSNKNRITCSTTCRNKRCGGFRSTSQLKKHQSVYNGYKMDSGAERYFAELLDSKNINWFKNDDSRKIYFPYIYEGKSRKYYPDFYLIDHDQWIEIKGKRYLCDYQDIKMSGCPNVTLVMSDNIKEFFDDFIKENLGQ